MHLARHRAQKTIGKGLHGEDRIKPMFKALHRGKNAAADMPALRP